MDCDDAGLLNEWTTHWRDLADFEIIPVLTSGQAKEHILGARK